LKESSNDTPKKGETKRKQGKRRKEMRDADRREEG